MQNRVKFVFGKDLFQKSAVTNISAIKPVTVPFQIRRNIALFDGWIIIIVKIVNNGYLIPLFQHSVCRRRTDKTGTARNQQPKIMRKQRKVFRWTAGILYQMAFYVKTVFPKHINKTQLVAATVIFKKIPPVFHNANKCRFIVPAIQNIIFAKTIMFRKTRFFKISNCFSIFPICHIPVFHFCKFFINTIPAKMHRQQKICLSFFNLSKQIRAADIDIAVHINALFILGKQFVRIYLMVTIVERIVFFGIDQWPYLPNALSLLGKKLFVIGKTNVIPVFIEIFVFPESIIISGQTSINDTPGL